MATDLICRACLKKKPQNSCRNITPFQENEENSDILEMLSYSIPELDIFLVVNPVICDSCVNQLEIAFKFKMDCLKNEEKILQYSHDLPRNLQSKVDLVNFYKNIRTCTKKDIKTVTVEINKINNIVKENTRNLKSDLRNHKYPVLKCKSCLGCKSKITDDPRQHSKINISPFECYRCNKKTDTIEVLRKHMLSHVKQRQCKVCGRFFRDLHNLKKHLRTHTGEKPFSCNICSKKFQQKHCLTQHLQQHQGSDALTCNLCSKTFSTKYNAAVHKNYAHKLMHICDLCGKSFFNNADLLKHLESDFETCRNFVKKEDENDNPIYDNKMVEEEYIKTEPVFDIVNENIQLLYANDNLEDIDPVFNDEIDVLN